MADIENDGTKLSRRDMFGLGSAAVAATTLTMVGGRMAEAQSAKDTAPNEINPGQVNSPLAAENPDSEWCPPTDNGNVKPFKYSFSLSRKRLESGGWTRQVTVRDLPISTTMAGVEMRLTAGGVRELHWHVEAEWAIMLYGSAPSPL